MKRLIILLVLCSVLVVAAPPSLSNHQFYGEISWEKTAAIPKVVTAKIGSTTFTSTIKAVPCVTDVCKGKYGYDTDNILRVTGSGTIAFSVDGKAVGTATYKDGDISKLDFDLSKKVVVKKEEKKVENKTVVNKTVVDTKTTKDTTTKTGTATKTDTTTVDTSPPTFQQPRETLETCFDGIKNQNEEGIDCGGSCKACAVEDKEEGFNFLLWGGIVLLLIAIIVVVIIFMRKGSSGGSMEQPQQPQY